MSTPTEKGEHRLTETLEALSDAVRILVARSRTTGKATKAHGAGPPGARAWLESPPSVLLFRTSKDARIAGDETVRHGYKIALFQRYLVIEAPWLFVAALAAGFGLGAEIQSIHWEDKAGEAAPRPRVGDEP
jgi:hypothetical protein